MSRNRILNFVLVLGLFGLAACGGGGIVNPPPPPPPGSSAPISVTVGDAPPPGVTVLSFEVTVTAASLQSNTGKADVALITKPTQIEIKQLEVESAFLNTASVPADTYKSITVTLTNPELTIKNDSGNPIPGCTPDPINKICEIKPMMSTSVVFSGSPFPLTVAANSPTGLFVDVNLANAITSTSGIGVDFSASGAVTVSQLAASSGQLQKMDDVSGTVANKDATNNQFTLQTMAGDLTVKVDANTHYEDFDQLNSACTANPQDFSCVQNGQSVEVDLSLVTGGTLLAKKIEATDDANQEDLEGVVAGNISPTGFDMVVVDESRNAANVSVGNLVHVNLTSGFSFRIDAGHLTFSPTLTFSTTADLLVGQHVEVKKQGFTAGNPPSVDSNRVTLKSGSVTGNVNAKLNATDFTINNLPPLFTNATPVINQIEVRTSSQTTFVGVTGVAALNVPPNADTVSVKGLLFKTTGDPVLVAKKVRKR